MPVGKDEFKQAMSRFAAGVTVVTTVSDEGDPRGLTVSAFSSLSLDPPLILVCIDNASSIRPSLKEGAYFAVNILSENQELISRRFATRDVDRFAGVGYKIGVTGTPLIEDAIAHVECLITGEYPGGDHTIVVGLVEAATTAEGKPLAYFRGGYSRLV